MSKLTLFLGRAIWNALIVVLISAIGGVIVYFGNKHMIMNTPETEKALLIMILIAIGFLTFFFLVRDYEKINMIINNALKEDL